ncbi:hypothetical protein B0H12DRAFT_1122368 [Mycena haematopus]|nr:hypothetical protein B0H12DRAFT_1122368 [Mycena haematopus]
MSRFHRLRQPYTTAASTNICPDIVRSRRPERETIQKHYIRRMLGFTEQSVASVLFSATR